MRSGAARFRMVLVTGSRGDRYLGLPTQERDSSQRSSCINEWIARKRR